MKVEADVLNLYKIVWDADDTYFANKAAMVEWIKRHTRISGCDFDCCRGIVYVDGVKCFRYEEVQVIVYK